MEFIILLTVFSFFAFFLIGLFFRIRQEKQQKKSHEELITHTVKQRFQSFMKVGGFLQHSKFINPIASWRGEKIYQYIFNEGFLYEFTDILPEDESKIEIDEKNLTFNQMLYTRLENNEAFLSHFSHELNAEEIELLRDFGNSHSKKTNQNVDMNIEKLNQINQHKEEQSLTDDNNENNKNSSTSHDSLLTKINQENVENINITNSINAYLKKTTNPTNTSSSIFFKQTNDASFIPDTVEPIKDKKESKVKHFLSTAFLKIKNKINKK